MKVCTCLVLFTIFVHVHSSAIDAEEESQVSANQEKKSVLEEANNDNQDNNDEPYPVKSFTKNDKTDIKSNLKVIYRAPGLTFTGFLEEIINIINTFDDTRYIDFLNTFDSAIRQYHYKGCKFSEVTNKYETRKFLASTLKMTHDQPISETRAKINETAETIKSKTYGNNVKELLDYINSLYATAGETLVSVVDDLEQFKDSQSQIDLDKVIKSGVRKVLFDYYTNLDVNTRRDLKHRMDTFWRRFKQNPASKRESQLKKINTEYEVKKFKLVRVRDMKRNKNLKNKREYMKSYANRNNQNRFRSRGSNYNTRGAGPKQGLRYNSRYNSYSKRGSRQRSRTSNPLMSVRGRDLFRRNVETNDASLEVDLYQYAGMDIDMNEKQHEKPKAAASIEISQEQKHSKSRESLENTKTPAHSKSDRDQRREMEAEIMKPTPQISFYLSTNSFKVRQFTLPPALKTHYNLRMINDTTELPLEFQEKESDSKFQKETMKRSVSSTEKDTHVIKRIKILEKQLDKVKNKVNIVNSEVVKIKKVLFKNQYDAKSSKETEQLRSGVKSEFKTTPDLVKVTKEELKTTKAVVKDKYTEASVEQKNREEEEEIDNENEILEVTKAKTASQTEVSLTKSSYGVTPNFKAKEKSKEKGKKKATTKSEADDEADDEATETVKTTKATTKTSRKGSSEGSMDTSLESSTTKAAITTKSDITLKTSETLAEPRSAKVHNSSQPVNVTKTGDSNTSLDVNDGKVSNNYVIKVY